MTMIFNTSVTNLYTIHKAMKNNYNSAMASKKYKSSIKVNLQQKINKLEEIKSINKIG